MAQLRIDADGFMLTSTWVCRVTYKYSTSDNSPSGSTCQQLNFSSATNTVQFDVSMPSGAEVLSAKVHADHTTGLYGGAFKINNITPDDDGFVKIDAPDFSSGSIDVQFSWAANMDSTTAHAGEAPEFNGSYSRVVATDHESPSTITNVYLLIEYKQNGLIYRAVSGAIVPYQIYRAEGGSLAPYQLFKAVNGELIQY